jgi:hypothetical protein
MYHGVDGVAQIPQAGLDESMCLILCHILHPLAAQACLLPMATWLDRLNIFVTAYSRKGTPRTILSNIIRQRFQVIVLSTVKFFNKHARSTIESRWSIVTKDQVQRTSSNRTTERACASINQSITNYELRITNYELRIFISPYENFLTQDTEIKLDTPCILEQ